VASRTRCRQFSISVDLQQPDLSSPPWSLCVVYGPVDDALKPAFLAELQEVHNESLQPLLLCGDFNMIYQAQDKNNSRLNLSTMRRFRRALDAMNVDKLYLHGRLYTWSNERRCPTMERIDRAFATAQWLEAFPEHHLRTLSSDSSDHAPVLLELRTETRATLRFCFEPFWTRMDGFLDAVQQVWDRDTAGVDACRRLDIKLRLTAKALKSWSMRFVGSVRQQLFMARELVAHFDKAQERRILTEEEHALRA